jgi:YD repeat-containing protein
VKNISPTIGEYFISYHYGLLNQTERVFSQTGTNPISTKTEFTYKYNSDYSYQDKYKGKHNQLIKTSTTKSNINTIDSFIKYVGDFDFGVDTTLVTCYDVNGSPYPCSQYTFHVPQIGSQARAIFEMNQRHILSPVIESFGANGRVANGQYIRFGKISISNSQFDYYPIETFNFGGVAGNFFIEMLYNRQLNDTIIKDYRFYPVASTLDFTRYGVAKKIKPFGGAMIETVFDSDAVLPLQSIINSGGIYKDTTSNEYALRFYGISKQIASNKLSVNYQYYRQSDQYHIGMLKSKTDKDGNVLVRYEYPYAGENLLGTAGTFTTDVSKNRVVVRTPRMATTDVYQDYIKVSTAVSYSDASGRSLKSIAYKSSPQGKDLLSATPEYDSFGRPKKSILPVPLNSSTGQFAGNAQNLARIFYNDSAAFSEVSQYEASPMSRVFKSIGTGKAFRPNKENIQSLETGNFGIANLIVSGTGILKTSFVGNKIIKSTVVDEMANKTITYSDTEGRTLEKHVQYTGDGSQQSHYLKTTYIYDEIGRLAVVLPPKLYGIVTGSYFSYTNVYNQIYIYLYDERGRLISKNVPDAGRFEYVYNRLNQPVMSRNPQQLYENKWEFVKYDAMGRTVQTGIINSFSDRQTLQTAFDNFTAAYQFEERSTILEGYTNASFPLSIGVQINAASIKTVSFYDDYTWNASAALNFSQYKTPRYTNAKGLLTGNKVRKLASTSSATAEVWLASALYYDDKNRLIQSQSENRFGLINQTDVVLDFIGQVLEEHTTYRKPNPSTSSAAITTDIATLYTYDHAGRKLSATHSQNGRLEPLASYEYDELGRLIKKKLNEAPVDFIVRQNETLNSRVDIAKKYILIKPGTTITPTSPYCAFIAAGLQQIAYQYNIRGSLRCINCTPSGRLDSSKVFSMLLDYHEDGRFYNGLMSQQSWKTRTDTTTRRFVYGYDKANRFINAVFKGKLNEKYNENLSYDEDGNIQSLNRFGLLTPTTYGRIDSLSYIYYASSNKLSGIIDNADLNKGHKDNGSATDYTYTFYDGSLKTDANKGITNIIYNYLGLPERIEFGASKRIENVYTADGAKLSSKFTDGTKILLKEYVGDLIYINDTLRSIWHDEGRIVFDNTAKATYQYFINDHLGSTRVVFQRQGDSVYVAQLINYSPSGVPLSELGSGPNLLTHLFQGKEWIDGFGYDFLSRTYDPYTLRMLQVDGADQFASGYTGMGNNPVNMIDPDGQVAAPVIIGGVMGGVGGWQLGKSKGATGWKMAGYIAGGIVVGALSGGFANSLLTSGIAYANTASIVGGSFVNSIGMNILSGGSSPINVSFGVASYDLTNNNLGYLFEKGNSELQNLGYALGAMANIQDVLAGFNPSTAELRTENDPNYSKVNDSQGNPIPKKDLIGHSQITDGKKTLIDWGPTEPVSGLRDWVKGTNDYEKGLLGSETMKWKPVNVTGVNMNRISRIGQRLNTGNGNYNICVNSCVSMTSRAFNLSGAFNPHCSFFRKRWKIV